jgi:NADPH:quinone reductase-like Zn-dependent oxidoreductase
MSRQDAVTWGLSARGGRADGGRQGFLAFQYVERQQECFDKLAALIRAGKVRTQETVVEGFDKVADAFVGLFRGENTGKMLIKVSLTVGLRQRVFDSRLDEPLVAAVTYSI